jgi:pimeloyl-ACP methyl ester carboxylesterase
MNSQAGSCIGASVRRTSLLILLLLGTVMLPALHANGGRHARVFEPSRCLWGVPRAPAVQHQPLRRRIPTLILTGEYDGVVSPDEGERIATSLRRAVLHQVPGAGHVVLSGACASGIASRFFDDPESVPDTSC